MVKVSQKFAKIFLGKAFLKFFGEGQGCGGGSRFSCGKIWKPYPTGSGPGTHYVTPEMTFFGPSPPVILLSQNILTLQHLCHVTKVAEAMSQLLNHSFPHVTRTPPCTHTHAHTCILHPLPPQCNKIVTRYSYNSNM